MSAGSIDWMDRTVMTMPLVTCVPWCGRGDGHPGEMARCDQWCGSEEVMVEPLVREYEYPLSEIARLGLRRGYREPDGFGVAGRRTPGRLDEVSLRHLGPDTEVLLTPDEARRLAAALLSVADLLDGSR